MNARHVTTFVGLMVLACLGCRAPLRIAPGLSAIRIEVIAEPKTGYRPSPRRAVSGYDGYGDAGGHYAIEGSFERVDYRALEDVVVWIEPETKDVPAMPSESVVIDLSPQPAERDHPPLYVIASGGRLRFRNRGPDVYAVYSFSASNEFDSGDIPPNGEATYVVRAPGLIEILNESQDDPVAHVFAAPTGHVRRLTSNAGVTFNDLPPGSYTAACWHARLPGSALSVVLEAEKLTEVSLMVSVNLLHPPR